MSLLADIRSLQPALSRAVAFTFRPSNYQGYRCLFCTTALYTIPALLFPILLEGMRSLSPLWSASSPLLLRVLGTPVKLPLRLAEDSN